MKTRDPLRFRFLFERLQTEFPEVPVSILVQALLYVERDIIPEETIEAYSSRIREAVRRQYFQLAAQ